MTASFPLHDPPFVVIEGLDGAGTTTQVRRLVDRLDEVGQPAIATREPSDGPVGVLIRQMLSKRVVGAGSDGEGVEPVGREILALLFAADRLDHVEADITPALEQGRLPISDRYYHSSFAYQADADEAGELDLRWVRTLNERAPAPDLTVFLEASPELCLSRMQTRGRRDIYETREHLENLAERYETVISALEDEGQTIVRLDASRSREAITEAIFEAIADLA